MNTQENPVEIKGQKEGLWIFLDDRIALHEVFISLEEKLASSNNFFHGADVTVDTGTRLLTSQEKKDLRTLVESTHSLHIKELTNIGKPSPPVKEPRHSHDDARSISQEEAVPEARGALEPSPVGQTPEEESFSDEDAHAQPSSAAPAGEEEEDFDREELDSDDGFMKFLDDSFRIPVKHVYREEKETYSTDYLYENEETAFYFRGTVRSGQSLEFPGNIVILGDVNPGAYVVAGGDIIVMGRLHGVVHAGAEGEERAVAIGMNFRPSQLRIAQYIGRPPDEGPRAQKKRPQAEKAYIKDGAIVIEPLL